MRSSSERGRMPIGVFILVAVLMWGVIGWLAWGFFQ